MLNFLEDQDEIVEQTIQREKRWNENYVNKKRKAYNKKYKVDTKIPFEKIFAQMNQKL